MTRPVCSPAALPQSREPSTCAAATRTGEDCGGRQTRPVSRFEPVDYKKADSGRYGEVLGALDAAGFQWVRGWVGNLVVSSGSQASIEGAESGLDLGFVAGLKTLGLQLGVVR